MGMQNSFYYRLRRKLAEHLDRDPTGISFVKYSAKFFLSKLKRQHITLGPEKISSSLDRKKINVAVKITGGLGDIIVIARILRDLTIACPNTCLYIFSPALKQAQWVFEHCHYVEAVFPIEIFEYYKDICDCTLFLNQFSFFDEQRIDVQKIQRLSPNLLNIFSNVKNNRRLWNIFIDNHPVLDGAFARQAVAIGENRQTFIYSLMKLEPSGRLLDLPMDCSLVAEIQKKNPIYVTFNTGFDHMFIITTKQATKCYPDVYWTTLIKMLKTRFPQIGIIQLGGKKSTHIPNTDIDLSGKTTLSECAGILKHSRLHIDIEGGLVHVAYSLGVKSVVLFGPTSLPYFAYPGNINLRDESCPECWWATERWMECCPQKKSRNECMYKLTPEKIFATIEQEVGKMNETVSWKP